MTYTLRPYQSEAVSSVIAKLADNLTTLLVAPVGAGKTIMQADIIKRTIDVHPQSRFVCAVHTRELVSQNAQALMRAWPGAPIGINAAALNRRDTHSQILFCSIQSVYRKARQIGHCDALIIDEAHLISPKGATMYVAFIDGLRSINPHMRVIGMTGTPYRLGTGSLISGDAPLFDNIAFDIPIRQLIDDGYLTRPISKATATGFDLSGVSTRGGEYLAGQLEQAVNVDAITQEAVSEIMDLGRARKAWLVFCAGVQHAKDVRDVFRSRGITCETVEGNTPAGERKSILRRYQAGEIRCLTNVNVLSTGFDYPGIDLVALMRPTKSCSLYVQQVGRALRLSPGKDDALVLDFAGVVRTLGPIDDIVPSGPKGTGDAPVKECPECQSLVHISKPECPDCGYAFPPPEEKPAHDARADGESAILSTEKLPPKPLPVVSWGFALHQKDGSPDSVRVTYIAGLQQVKEWLAFDHGGYARQKANEWWSLHGGSFPLPKSTSEALERKGELTCPDTLTTAKDGRYTRIAGRTFARAKEAA